jgi:L-asparaginase
MPQAGKPKIAVFSGPTSTIANSQPLVTSNKARLKYGLLPRLNSDGSAMRFDVLRAQRLAAPVTVYVEQFSAHPLERDAAELYAAPDGYLDADGQFSPDRKSSTDVPVYEVTLKPEDGLYALPYMGRQANGSAWEDDGVAPSASPDQCRQPFYPDASRIFEEIDRLGVGNAGVGNLLSSRADFDFYRAAPGGGYKKGLPAAERTDIGEGDIPPERLGVDFFPYRPFLRQAQRGRLALVTNMLQRALDSGTYAGAVWIEGSPSVEESAYWLSLLIDTRIPISCNAAQRPHGALANDGDHNLVDSVEYIVSRAWADRDGRDRVGVVMCQDGQIFAAREVQKADARPGGYIVTGGHGGILGRVGEAFPPTPTRLTFVPTRRHTADSDVNVRQLPASVWGAIRHGAAIEPLSVPIKTASGDLLPTAIPKVSIVKEAQQFGGDAALDDGSRSAATEVDILARIAHNLEHAPLAGFVGEGMAPYGFLSEAADAALRQAVFCGMPVVKVGRGNNEGFTSQAPPFLSGNNLTASKARLLLMACLMKFGSLPIARDACQPTETEFAATIASLARYQMVFDTH